MADRATDRLLLRTAPSRVLHFPLYVVSISLAGLSLALSTRLLALGLPTVAGYALDLLLALGAGVVSFLLFLLAELKRLTRRYLVYEHRVARREGILSRRIQYTPYAKVQRVELVQPFLQRILGIGDLLIDTGEDMIALEAVRNPTRVERILAERMTLLRPVQGPR